MKRTFYFLKDSVSGKFYTGQSDFRSDFDDAAVYYQEKNAKKKIKDIIHYWEHNQKYDSKWYKENFTDLSEESYKDYVKKAKIIDAEVAKRKGLKDWGVEIVSKEVAI